MLFSEEMAVLSDRFRDVTVTLAAPAPLPRELPPTWLEPQTADCVVRFVDSEYRSGESERAVAAKFAGVRDVECEAMPLRAIFLAIAKSGRKHAAATRTSEGMAKA